MTTAAEREREFTIHYYARLILEGNLTRNQFQTICLRRLSDYDIEREVMEEVSQIYLGKIQKNIGICDDCTQLRPRMMYGKVEICAVCLAERRRVGLKIQEVPRREIRLQEELVASAAFRRLNRRRMDPEGWDDRGARTQDGGDALDRTIEAYADAEQEKPRETTDTHHDDPGRQGGDGDRRDAVEDTPQASRPAPLRDSLEQLRGGLR